MKINVNKQENKEYTFKDVKTGDVFYSSGAHWVKACNLSNANAVDLSTGCGGWFQDHDKVTLVRAVLEVTHENS